jgi:hypothetical protein
MGDPSDPLSSYSSYSSHHQRYVWITPGHSGGDGQSVKINRTPSCIIQKSSEVSLLHSEPSFIARVLPGWFGRANLNANLEKDESRAGYIRAHCQSYRSHLLVKLYERSCNTPANLPIVPNNLAVALSVYNSLVLSFLLPVPTLKASIRVVSGQVDLTGKFLYR